MKIRDIEFPFDPGNANDLQRVDEVPELTKRLAAEAEAKGYTSAADEVRAACRVVIAGIDHMLGEGACEKLGLDGNSLTECAKVADEVRIAIAAEQAAVYSALGIGGDLTGSRKGNQHRRKKQRR